MNKLKNCLIVSGGEFFDLGDITNFVESESYDYIIACDKGFEYALKLGLNPDLVVGDFDSCTLDKEFLKKYKTSGRLIELPHEKDDTDTIFALKIALEKQINEVTFVCALGKRFDHTFSNIQTLNFAAQKDCLCKVYSANDRLYTICGKKNLNTLKLKRLPGYSLSVFSLTNKSKGVCITGAKYELHNFTLKNSFPLGQSNEWLSDEVTISLKKGILLVVCSRI